MDSDQWASRLAAAKRNHSRQHRSSLLERIRGEDFDEEEDGPPGLPCPYCHEVFDDAFLCAHLEENHPFESGAAVCPICSVKVSRDLLNHITMQHTHMFKLQRRSSLHKVSVPIDQALSFLRGDLKDIPLEVLLRGGGFPSINRDVSASVPDSLLSSLLSNFPPCEVGQTPELTVCIADDTYTKSVVTSKPLKSSIDPSLSYEERERRVRQATVRAAFVQYLLASTMFGNSQ